MEATFIFVYSKCSEIKVLNIENATLHHEELIKSGYVHTLTLDACVWIENLHNNTKDIIKEVMSLHKTPF